MSALHTGLNLKSTAPPPTHSHKHPTHAKPDTQAHTPLCLSVTQPDTRLLLRSAITLHQPQRPLLPTSPIRCGHGRGVGCRWWWQVICETLPISCTQGHSRSWLQTEQTGWKRKTLSSRRKIGQQAVLDQRKHIRDKREHLWPLQDGHSYYTWGTLGFFYYIF